MKPFNLSEYLENPSREIVTSNEAPEYYRWWDE